MRGGEKMRMDREVERGERSEEGGMKCERRGEMREDCDMGVIEEECASSVRE